jgi:hypothetical protein
VRGRFLGTGRERPGARAGCPGDSLILLLPFGGVFAPKFVYFFIFLKKILNSFKICGINLLIRAVKKEV